VDSSNRERPFLRTHNEQAKNSKMDIMATLGLVWRKQSRLYCNATASPCGHLAMTARRIFQQTIARAALAAFVLALWPGYGLAAETEEAVTISVEDAKAKVGEQTTIVAKISPRDGFEIAKDYRNRVMKLSAEDKGVTFQSDVVRGTLQDGGLVFKVAVTPMQAGAHAINGIFRFAFVSVSESDRRLDIKWAPLTATVTGE
jgi:hypothetical protein